MIFSDEKLARRVAPHLQRVLVVDGATASARLLTDILKSLGARHVIVETSDSELGLVVFRPA